MTARLIEPHVWVIEERVGRKWHVRNYNYPYKSDAVAVMRNLNGLHGRAEKRRIAKYIREAAK